MEIYIGNLQKGVDTEHLQKIFEKVGYVQHIRITSGEGEHHHTYAVISVAPFSVYAENAVSAFSQEERVA